MRSSFDMWVSGCESARFATQPACRNFSPALRSAVSIACVRALRMLRLCRSTHYAEGLAFACYRSGGQISFNVLSP
jgi:hypothetical protein